jgi:hypothetical protein
LLTKEKMLYNGRVPGWNRHSYLRGTDDFKPVSNELDRLVAEFKNDSKEYDVNNLVKVMM